jgi:hypothetical protein
VIVTGTGQPLDINLYQTIKALVGIEPLLDADHGDAGAPVVVLLSRCWDGGGSEEMFEPFLKAHERLRAETGSGAPGGMPGAEVIARAVFACLESDYTIEMDESYFMARVTPKCRAVIACCPGVRDERLRLLGWEPARDGDSAVARALELSHSATRVGRGPEPDEGGSRLVVLCPRAQRALFA